MKNFIYTAGLVLYTTFAVQANTKPSTPCPIKVKVMVKQWDVKRNEDALKETHISVINESGDTLQHYYSDEEGYCQFYVKSEHSFVISITKKDYVAKSMYVGIAGPLDKSKKYGINCEVTLFKKNANVDLSVLDKPILKINYNKTTSQFDYDSLTPKTINENLKKQLTDAYLADNYMLKPILIKADFLSASYDNRSHDLLLTGENENEFSNIVFKVQLISKKSPLPLNDIIFNDCGYVNEYRNDDLYNYTTGQFTTLEQAQNHVQVMIQKGFTDAFVVAFKEGKRIPVTKTSY